MELLHLQLPGESVLLIAKNSYDIRSSLLYNFVGMIRCILKFTRLSTNIIYRPLYTSNIMPFYAVAKGNIPGIYTEWWVDSCWINVFKFSNTTICEIFSCYIMAFAYWKIGQEVHTNFCPITWRNALLNEKCIQ